MTPSSPPYIIGIAGGTASGKSTLVDAIKKKVGSERVVILAYDSYYKDLSHLTSIDERLKTNFDHPNALDTPLLIDHLNALRAGQPINSPQYDFTTCIRLQSVKYIEPKNVIIVEGILVLANVDLRSLFDLKVYVDVNADERLARRLERDIEARGRQAINVIAQYRETVRPMHEQFVEPSKRYADIVISGENGGEQALDAIAGQILARIGAARLEALGGITQRLLWVGHNKVKHEVVELAARELGADNVTLHQYDSDRDDFLDPKEFSATWPAGGSLNKPRKDGASAYVVKSGTAVIQDIAEEQNQGLAQTLHLAETNTKAFLGIRLEVGEDVVGVLFCNYLTPRKFSADERTLASILSAYAAIAIHRAQLHEQILQRTTRLHYLSEVAQSLLSSEYTVTKRRIVELAARELGADNVTLHQYDSDRDDFLDPKEFSVTWPAGGSLNKPRKDGASAYVVKSGTAVIQDIAEEQNQGLAQTLHLAETNTKAFLGIRLEVGEDVIGVLFCNYLAPRKFSADERELASILGAYAAMAIQWTILFEKGLMEQRAKQQVEAALGELQADIIHYTKNMIGLIRLDSQDLLDLINVGELHLAPAQYEKLNQIRLNAEVAIDRVNRGLASRRPVAPKRLSIDDLLNETKQWIKEPYVSTGIHVEFYKPSNVSEVYVDGLRTSFVFAELILNAQKAIASTSLEKGTIKVTAHDSDDEGYVDVLFTNNGPIIPKQYWERIFEGLRLGPDGTPIEISGTGLWRARTLLSAQGGSIKIIESAATGTTFLIQLPKSLHKIDRS